MGNDRISRLGILGATLTLICLGISGERATVLNDSLRMNRDGRVVALAGEIFRVQPATNIPMLRGVQWTDTGPAGERVNIQADDVSRRSRRVGPLTFESYQEIVATKVLVQVVGHRRTADHYRKDNASKILSQIEERLVNLYAMVRGGLHSKPDPEHLFTQTFLAGIAFEDLVLEVGRDAGVGRLRSQTISAAPEGVGWNLQGVQVEATDGRRLTIDEARWTMDGRLVAYGPFSLERNKKRAAAGLRGCFLVHLSNSVEIHGPIWRGADAALCAPNPLQIRNSLGLPTTAMPFPEGGVAWPNIQAIPFAEKLPLLALPTNGVRRSGGHRADRRKQSGCCPS